MRHKVLLPVLLILTLGCAVHRNPNVTPETLWQLNAADQLQQLERDYKTLFTDVGNAQRQGVLTQTQVDTLNAVGHRLKPAIETANRSYKAWQSNPTDAGKQAVIVALRAAQAILQELSTRKAQLMNGGL